jgi:type IV secretory pathway VirB2 component (pilin)
MLPRRKSLAALAALTAALAVAVPASASAAATTTPTVDPTVCQLLNLTSGPFGPTQFIIGGASLGAVLAHAGATVGCPAPAPSPSPLLPIAPWW